MQEWFLFHQTVNPDFLYSKHLYKNGLLYKNKPTVKPNGRRSKHEKERKKQEIRIHNAQLKATVSVAGVAAAVAAISATSAKTTLSETSVIHNKSVAIASAAALVASHCIEIAEEMGADQDQILTVVDSAINARTSGDIMTLTAGAATALRGAATLRATLQKGYGSVQGNSVETSTALNFVFVGGELLKRTRKGALHWKQLSFYRNSNGQVVAKMKSKHMGGAFTKKKKCVILEVYCDIPAWPGREREGGNERRDYFGIKTIDRIIEFQCRGKGDKLMWTQGIQHMLNSRATMTWC